MTILIELSPEEEAWLREQAAHSGQEPERLARELLRAQMPRVGCPTLQPVLDEQGIFHPERWDGVLRALAQRTSRIPVLPDEALTREALYQDHE